MTLYRRQGSRPSPWKRNEKKSKMAVWGGLTNSCEKKRSEKQGEKEIYKHLSAEFQRKGRRSLPQRSMQRNRGKEQNGKE